jgi:uncharacterized protein
MNMLIAGFSFFAGVLIGLTGVGGGSLVTPVLILLFGVSPLAAVSSDLVSSLVIKPFGGALHASRRRVDRSLLAWLCVGSVPAAFSGALLLSFIPNQDQVNGIVRVLVGITLGLSAIIFLTRVFPRPAPADDAPPDAIRVRPLPVVALGALAGLLVGLTSIGSGSVIMAGLLMMYPRMPVTRLVGTDVVHSIPMVGAATLGHLLYGQVHIAVAASLILGGIPGVLIGAYLTAKVSTTALRSTLGVLLVAVSLTLLQVPVALVLAATAATTLIIVARAGVRRAGRARLAAASAGGPPVSGGEEAE